MLSTHTRLEMKTGRSIAMARDAKGMKQSHLADKLGLSYGYMSALESKGKLSGGLIERFEKVLGELPDDPLAESVERKPYGFGGEVRPVISEGNAIIPWYSTVVKAGTGGITFDEHIRQFNIALHYSGTAIYDVSGDSMIDAGIEEGDRLVVKLGYQFKPRSIILCKCNGELMVKGATIDKGSIWLFPANPKYHKWKCKETDEFQCIGTVVEVIKDPATEWWDAFDFSNLDGGKR